MATNKKRKKNCYAIYYTDSGESIIVKTWEECQRKTQGRANKFKGFGAEHEAQKWLNEIAPNAKSTPQKQLQKHKEKRKSRSSKAPFQLELEQQALSELRKRAAILKMQPEILAENLILEYLYDLET